MPNFDHSVLWEMLATAVAHPSPTADVQAVSSIQRLFASWFERLGFGATYHQVQDRGPILELRSAAQLENPIILLLHADTVHQGISKPLLVEDGDRLRGPGVLDLKAAIVSTYAAIQELVSQQALPSTAVRILISGCEESPTRESQTLIRELTADARAVLVMEYGRELGGLILARKGRLVAKLSVCGSAAHAGNSTVETQNSIVELAKLIAELPSLATKFADVSIQPTSVGGGRSDLTNVIPATAECLLDCRFSAGAQAALVEELTALAKRFGGTFEALWTTDARGSSLLSDELYQLCEQVSRELGMECSRVGLVGGLSDLNAVPEGVPAIDALGPFGGGAHNAETEWVSRQSILDCAKRLVRILQSLAAPPRCLS